METIKRDRRLPAVILLASLIVCALCLFPSGGAAPQGAMPHDAGIPPSDSAAAGSPGALKTQLAGLEKIIGQGRADSTVWTQYARCQVSLGAYRDAAQAYELALKDDPLNRDLLLQRGAALARAGNAEDLYSYVFQLSLRDPRLTYDLLDRPEFKPYLASPRFRKIYQDTYDQYLD